MSTTTAASTSKPTEATPATKEPESTPHLGVLEEDDEFEEFEAAGMFT
jgi:26 proteasome complex subunit DSS1